MKPLIELCVLQRSDGVPAGERESRATQRQVRAEAVAAVLAAPGLRQTRVGGATAGEQPHQFHQTWVSATCVDTQTRHAHATHAHTHTHTHPHTHTHTHTIGICCSTSGENLDFKSTVSQNATKNNDVSGKERTRARRSNFLNPVDFNICNPK